jgi:hypothetical protein
VDPAAGRRELLSDGSGRVDGDGETNPLRHDVAATARAEGIEADDLAGQVEEWTTGVGRVDRGIGLNQIVRLDARPARCRPPQPVQRELLGRDLDHGGLGPLGHRAHRSRIGRQLGRWQRHGRHSSCALGYHRGARPWRHADERHEERQDGHDKSCS